MLKASCVVYKTEYSSFSLQSAWDTAQAIQSGGYDFGEIRIVNSEVLLSALQSEKEKNNALFLLTDKGAFTQLAPFVQSIYKNEIYTSETFVVYQDGDKTVYVTTVDVANAANELLPYLQKKSGMRTGKLVIRSVGASIVRIESLLADTKRLSNGLMRYRHQREYDEDVIEIFYGENAPKMLIDDILRLFADGLADTMYALDDTPLAKQLVELLKLRGKTLSVAESFTGGGIAKKIVEISGASSVYFEGLNTYNELSKVRRLGVSEYTLHTYGAVSDQTAYEMAAGLIADGTCDISIATTGLAGPNSDRSGLPIGLCYIAIGTKERVFVYRYKFDGNREEITQKAIRYALFLAYKQLKNM